MSDVSQRMGSWWAPVSQSHQQLRATVHASPSACVPSVGSVISYQHPAPFSSPVLVPSIVVTVEIKS